MARSQALEMVAAEIRRPECGPTFSGECGLPLEGLSAWQSNGGATRADLARAYPLTLEFAMPRGARRLHLVGCFARYAGRELEAPGTLGASLHFLRDEIIAMRVDLFNGRHYGDAADLVPVSRLNGDGSSIETVGLLSHGGEDLRVDVLTIDIADSVEADVVRFRDLGSPASFAIFDAIFEVAAPHGCPFHSEGHGVPLADVAPSLRLGDRRKFDAAVIQMERAVRDIADLDEARGQSLTFLAIVSATTLEMGGGRNMHRELLDAAREVDRARDNAEVAQIVRRRLDEIAGGLFRDAAGPSAYLVERALNLVERHFAKPLTDVSVANELGLSTSHFRFLFRQATNQPFHKYLVNLRLEKARLMLIEQDMAVAEVARAVGFTGLSHFSRAFTQRFAQSPISVRRSAQHT